MGKIRQLRLGRPEEREIGLGREELAALLGEREAEAETARSARRRRDDGKRGGKKTR